MLSRFFIPSWSGDFRLEVAPDKPDHSLLTVENPTASDIKKLKPFLAHAREAGWIPTEAGISAKGRSALQVQASVTTAGPVLAGVVYDPATALWVVVSHRRGKVTIEDTDTGKVDQVVRKASETMGADIPPQTDVAVVKPPGRGCPAPESCERRASEVLRAFVQPSQYLDYERHGCFKVFGNRTGEAYLVFHRDEAARRGLDHALWSCRDRRTVCAWDHDVPAEEEMLTLALAAEHREGWLLDLG